MIDKIKSTLARLMGGTPVTAMDETIWSKEWCAKEPALAASAIATLQGIIKSLETSIKINEVRGRIESNRKVSLNPRGVYLSSLPPSTRFRLLRTGEIYFTSGRGWRQHYNAESGNPAKLHGLSRVLVLTRKPE